MIPISLPKITILTGKEKTRSVICICECDLRKCQTSIYIKNIEKAYPLEEPSLCLFSLYDEPPWIVCICGNCKFYHTNKPETSPVILETCTLTKDKTTLDNDCEKWKLKN